MDFSDFIRTFVPSFCALLFYNAALRLGEIAGVAVSGVFTTLERVKFKYSVAILKSSNPQPIGFSGILLAKRQNSFYCTYKMNFVALQAKSH